MAEDNRRQREAKRSRQGVVDGCMQRQTHERSLLEEGRGARHLRGHRKNHGYPTAVNCTSLLSEEGASRLASIKNRITSDKPVLPYKEQFLSPRSYPAPCLAIARCHLATDRDHVSHAMPDVPRVSRAHQFPEKPVYHPEPGFLPGVFALGHGCHSVSFLFPRLPSLPNSLAQNQSVLQTSIRSLQMSIGSLRMNIGGLPTHSPLRPGIAHKVSASSFKHRHEFSLRQVDK